MSVNIQNVESMLEDSFLTPHINNTWIEALTGSRCSGKTTTADYFIEVDPRFKKKSFAHVLKTRFAYEHSISIEELYNRDTKEKYRRGMQLYSKEFLSKDPFYFAKALFEDITPGDSIVIDDARLFPEWYLIVKLGGSVSQVFADQATKVLRGWSYDSVIDTDISETDVANFSWETFNSTGGTRFWNNGTLDGLKEQINTYIINKRIKRKRPYLV